MTMSLQEMFDKAATHLLKQNAKSQEGREGHTPLCLYRGPNGRACAAGCFIPDDRYVPEMEAISVHSAMTISKHADHPLTVVLTELGYADPNRRALLASLQRIHDGSDVEDWRRDLGYLATGRGLNTDALPALDG